MKHSNISIFIPHLGCPFRCAFCAQNDISDTEHPPSPDEVRSVIDDAFGRMTQEQRAQTEIAFFGGSFTAIPRRYMTELLEISAPYVKIEDGFKGIRCSTRPDCIDDEILSLLAEYGVTAIELGAQSMDDEVLAANHRGHTAEDVERSTAMIHARGFETGLQMMTGLYKATPESDLAADRIIALHPDTLRIYPTVVIAGTELGRLYEAGIYKPYPFDENVDVCAEIYEKCIKEGIRVIRLGLHAERSLEEKMLGGAYHQAMGEVVRGRLFRNRLNALLEKHPTANAVVEASPNALSIVCGHKRANREYFGERVRFCTNAALPISTAYVTTDDGQFEIEII